MTRQIRYRYSVLLALVITVGSLVGQMLNPDGPTALEASPLVFVLVTFCISLLIGLLGIFAFNKLKTPGT